MIYSLMSVEGCSTCIIGLWFYQSTSVSSTYITECQNITDSFLKVS